MGWIIQIHMLGGLTWLFQFSTDILVVCYFRRCTLRMLIVFCVGVLFVEVIFKLCINTPLEFRLKPNKWLLRDIQVVLLTWWQDKLALAFKTVESTVKVLSFWITKMYTKFVSRIQCRYMYCSVLTNIVRLRNKKSPSSCFYKYELLLMVWWFWSKLYFMT